MPTLPVFNILIPSVPTPSLYPAEPGAALTIMLNPFATVLVDLITASSSPTANDNSCWVPTAPVLVSINLSAGNVWLDYKHSVIISLNWCCSSIVKSSHNRMYLNMSWLYEVSCRLPSSRYRRCACWLQR